MLRALSITSRWPEVGGSKLPAKTAFGMVFNLMQFYFNSQWKKSALAL